MPAQDTRTDKQRQRDAQDGMSPPHTLLSLSERHKRGEHDEHPHLTCTLCGPPTEAQLAAARAKRKVPHEQALIDDEGTHRQKVIYPGNAKQKAVCDELDRTVGVAGTTWMQDSECEEPVEVRTCTMATYLIKPDGRVEEGA